MLITYVWNSLFLNHTNHFSSSTASGANWLTVHIALYSELILKKCRRISCHMQCDSKPSREYLTSHPHHSCKIEKWHSHRGKMDCISLCSCWFIKNFYLVLSWMSDYTPRLKSQEIWLFINLDLPHK